MIRLLTQVLFYITIAPCSRESSREYSYRFFLDMRINYRQSGLIQFVRLFIIVPAALNPKIVRVLATFVVGAQLHLRNSC